MNGLSGTDIAMSENVIQWINLPENATNTLNMKKFYATYTEATVGLSKFYSSVLIQFKRRIDFASNLILL